MTKYKNFSFYKKKTFIIAEIGNNHEGNYSLAKKLISKAADCEVDAVKFQTCIPENFISNLDPERIKKLNKVSFSKKQLVSLSNYAKKKKIIFFSTPLDLNSAKFLNKFCPIFKVASCDNNYYDLIDEICKYNKPLIISSGMADIKLLKKLEKKIFKKINNKKKFQLAFLHCVSSYPADATAVNLNSIKYMKNKLKKSIIGYSDHTKGIKTCIYAVAIGAKIIEKHFTINKKYSKNFDHHLSADPNEMKKMVQEIRYLEKIQGDEFKKINKDEKKNIKTLRRSFFYKKNIKKNRIIKNSDLIMLRPGIGISNEYKKLLVGKFLSKNVKKGSLVRFGDFK